MGSLRELAEVTLALILFSDASRIDLRALRDGYAVPARLLGIGLPLTVVAGTLAAVLVLPHLGLAEAVVLAVVLAATDAALGQQVVSDERLPASIRQGLNVESGLNDGLCVPALPIALAFADTEARTITASDAERVVAEAIGYGLLMGAVAGLAAAVLQRRTTPSHDEEQAHWRWLLSPVAAAFAYGLAAPLGGSGFIAAFVAGLVFGAASGRQPHTGQPLPAQDLGALVNALTFIVFGAVFMKPLIERASWQVALYALLSLTVVRMLPVAARSLCAAPALARSFAPDRCGVMVIHVEQNTVIEPAAPAPDTSSGRARRFSFTRGSGVGVFGFPAMEFDTLARRGVAVVGVIGNDGIWALEKNPMESLWAGTRLHMHKQQSRPKVAAPRPPQTPIGVRSECPCWSASASAVEDANRSCDVRRKPRSRSGVPSGHCLA